MFDGSAPSLLVAALTISVLFVSLCSPVVAECQTSNCGAKGKVTLKEGELFIAKNVTGLFGAKLVVNLELYKCDGGTECAISIFLLSETQYASLKDTLVADVPKLKFLEKGSNYYPNITTKAELETYFQGTDPLTVSVIFWAQPDKQTDIKLFSLSYNVEYTFDTCSEAIMASYGILIGFMLVFAVSTVVISILQARRDIINANNVADSIELREQDEAARITKDKQLRGKKEDTIWLNKPSFSSLRACQCKCLQKPPYPFFPYYYFTQHDWLSIIIRGPRPDMTRGNRLLVTATKLILCVLILTSWTKPILSYTSDIVKGVAPKEYEEIAVEIFSKALLTWLVIELFGAFYTPLVSLTERWGRIGSAIYIGGSRYDVDDSESGPSIWRRAAAGCVYYIPAILLLLLSLGLFIAVIVVVDKTAFSCSTLMHIGIQLLVIEIAFKTIFPGPIFTWCRYLFFNTFGASVGSFSPFLSSLHDESEFDDPLLYPNNDEDQE